MAGPRPKLFTIPPGTPFLPTLADAILDGRVVALPGGGDPLGLADLTLLLPTRRAVRAMREILVGRLGGEAAILPVIRPIGDIDEEDHLLSPAAETGAERLMLPPAVSRLARQLALTRLTLAWGKAVRRETLALGPDEPLLIPASAADATRLAADLARLMDDIETAAIPPDDVRHLAPDDHARYFQITLDFLKIAFDAWPAALAEMGLADPATRRDSLIRAAAERLKAGPRRGPVIAAGSTGTIPATAALLNVIAHLADGAVVLPGLDQDLDAEGWTAIGESASPGGAFGHPQYGLKRLLGEIGATREDVEPLGTPDGPGAARARLLAEALRPAETTEHWASFRASGPDERTVEAGLAGATLAVARNEQEEAVAIAIAAREALEEGLATVAIVTPDRTLARRVAAELRRWRLDVDDSAGAKLDLLPEGVFARLVAEAALAEGDPVALLALLKHPLAAFGMDRPDCRRGARMLELALFRGRRVPGGVARLGEALAKARREAEDAAARHIGRARRRLNKADWILAERLTGRLMRILGPLEAAFTGHTQRTAGELAGLLVETLRSAAADQTGSSDALWQGGGGEALATLLAGIAEGGGDLAMTGAEFPPFLAALTGEVTVARRPGADPRLHIWGTLEARLQSADLLVLAGLDEGVWPAETRTDPWLSRAMRAELGLPAPERRIGLAAHDFAQGFAAARVMVTRAEKRGGAPTVASRWLQRLAALVGARAFERMTTRGARYLDLARQIDAVPVKEVTPVKPPLPMPPVADRPRSLSVTEIEVLVRDPYAIYAKHVLKLEELDPLGKAPDFALRGSLIHDALGRFTAEWSGPYNAAALDRLTAIGREALAEIEDFPDLHAIWSMRFAAIARWLVGFEARRDGAIAARHAEVSGAIAVPGPAGDFRLRGRADRIDLRRDGTVDVLDFKTGTPPSAKQVLSGFAPQLGLEAAMVRLGGFDEKLAGAPLRDRSIATLAWIGLGRVERGEPVVSAVEKDWTADAVAGRTLDHLKELVAAYDDPARAYASRARPMFETRYESPYDHLARVREWALVESEEDLSWLVPPRP
jgi:ATP-dependent helicase/nuclease subunit B